MRNIRSAFLIGALALLPILSFGADAVYLKALGSGETRETQDGTSWATAFADVHDAVAAAVAASQPLYVAGGIYNFTNFITLASGQTLAVYGGFPGASNAETVDDRDTTKYETVFTGDKDLDDTWYHCVTNTNYGLTKTELTGQKIISDGKLNLPPAFTEEFDTYCQCLKGSNVNAAFYVNGGALSVDGVTFSGFYTGSDSPPATSKPNQANSTLMTVKGTLSVNHCRFVGNTTGVGFVYGKASFTLENCDFLHGWGANRGCAVTTHAGIVATIRNCRFISISRTSSACSQLFSCWSGSNGVTFDITGCTIARSLLCTGSSYTTDWGGPANICGGENFGMIHFQDSVISNCCTACSSQHGLSMMSGNGVGWLTRCFVTNNLCIWNPAAGKSYCMFSRTYNNNSYRRIYEGTTFAGNEVRAQGVAATSGCYAMGIVGNNVEGPDSYLVNCTFDSNRAVAPEKEGVTKRLSRGVVICATSSDSTVQGALANCTFTGPRTEDVYDIVHYGTGHTLDLNLVNCIFDAAGASAPDPVYSDVPSKVHFIQSSVLNCHSPNASMNYEGLEWDKIPLVKTVVDAGIGRYVCIPDAKVPGLRATCDVATNVTTMTRDVQMSWVFRRPGSDTWEPLASKVAKSGSGWDAKLIDDARSEARTAGAFTRGSVQRLSDAAESGKSVVVRIDPPAAGSVTAGPVSQAVATGGTMQSVTVASVDDEVYEFGGWYDAAGTKVEETKTLTSTSLSLVSDVTVVTAKFSAADVNLTYDLGPSGKFENGLSTITVSVLPGSILVVPSYTVNEGWIVFGFDVPASVPKTNATYVADYVTKSVRTIYVTPEGAGKKDGSSWANAYDDLATAYADAAKYRGEVWLKKGFYRLSAAIAMQSNVSVLGGFDGDETSASEADPTNNLSVLSGDANDDDYWQPNGSGGSLAAYKIWQDGVYNPPNPTRANAYWAASGNVSDNASTAFACDGVATNNVFDGLVVSGFKNGAFLLNGGDFSGIAIRRCRFLGNNTSAGTADESLGMIRLVASCLIEDCVFDGNYYPISMVANLTGQKLTVRRSVFQNGLGNCRGSGGIRIDANGVALDLSDSRFYRNYCSSRDYQPASSLVFRSSCSGTVTDCSFEEDLNNADSHGSIVLSCGGVTFTRCRFERNAMRETGTSRVEDWNSACVWFKGSGAVLFRDCLFAENLLALKSGDSSHPTYAGAFINSSSSPATFVNTTFLNNVVTHQNAADVGCVLRIAGNTAFVNCTIRDSTLSGVSTSVSDIRVTGTPTVGIVNTVICSTNDGYRSLTAVDSSWTPNIANSYVQGFDRTAYEPLATNGYLYDVVTEGSVNFSASPKTNELGVVAWGVSGYGPARGRPVWLKDGVAYFHDTVADSAMPWRKVYDRTSYAASVSGLATDSPRIPDAFGRPRRRLRDCTIGPLESKPGLILFVK